MFLCGSRSSFHAPANEINFSNHWPHPWRGPAGGMNIPQLADNLTDNFAPSDWSSYYSPFLWVLHYNVHVFTCVCTVSQAVCMCTWLIIILTRVTEARSTLGVNPGLANIGVDHTFTGSCEAVKMWFAQAVLLWYKYPMGWHRASFTFLCSGVADQRALGVGDAEGCAWGQR